MTAPGDPRLRLVAAVVAVAAISLLQTLPVAAAALVVAALVALLNRPDPRLWRRLLHVEGFLLLLFATLPFTVAGPSIATIGPLSVSGTGLWRAGLIALKVSASVLVLLVLLGDLEPERLGAALRALGVPERLCRLFVTTARYATLLREEARRLGEAMRARGFHPRSNRHTWNSYGNLLGMILVRALERASRVEEAMLCRGYAGHYPYSSLASPRQRDWVAFALVSGAAFLALVIDRL
ncbi:cobalt ECF transporter T component CbiQ [Ancylobacter oerskovii]|uniref:Cobalt ECF transporter T component CbiQ n=1 Tax=Ancylobacter oerskovii TaxID=459519 RepID=A0ABW4Z5S1_9HYPH|nr:cobalt ECF transporter T component CbiQ [Ancylobacter oerskovii]